MANVTRIEGKRGVTYRIDYIDPKGKRIRRMFKKKKEASAELAKRVSLMAEGRYLDVKKDTKVTLGELFDRYAMDCQKQRSFHTHKRVWVQGFIDFMGRKFDTEGKSIKASAVTWALVSEWISDLENTPTNRVKTEGVRQPGSVNRAIGAIRHMFNMAVEWDMIERSPFAKARRVGRKESKHRERFLIKAEIERLLREFEHLPHLHRVVEFAILTGLDKSDILNLQWNDIQKRLILENGEEVEIEVICTHRGKTSIPVEIPVNEDIRAILNGIRKEEGLRLPDSLIFTRDGEYIKRLDKGYQAAVRRAGLASSDPRKHVNFKTLRHTFGSHLAMQGRHLLEIKELMGHTRIETTMKYAHLMPSKKVQAMGALSGLTGRKLGMAEFEGNGSLHLDSTCFSG